ncbi:MULTISPECIES: serine/threonine-protein kinase [Okeania]|uniref:Serine/threonine protein kinase n=1 Tax=Okeania hirsuta TaxID=1458930 RepID=A0A3N6Q570_9CYAN|nr:MULTISPECIES: serine/threonine-protein kinase [Okeania]NES89773.1 protein kinase [Okeania sp. SIO2B9]NET78805.1 protein kinase [Okeania sp. SIO1F9]RQH10380.1 serine/threonine protein kinase [Okeania hirsuta]RQH38977.1 serine/threonine protein kinase [Okeania hirsuta]
MINKILRHRYKIISELGKGGFGTTYLALDLDLPNHPQCVVKQLAPYDPRPEVFQVAKTLFEKEAITLQRLGEHNQIPRLFAYFEEGGQFYLVQEFIEGNDLTKEIYPGKNFGEDRTIQLLTEILSVLQYVHQQNVIHRDLKLQNIMRRKSDRKIVLIDFGAVKEIKGLAITTGGHTTMTIAVGTPGYMPSEQAAGQPRFCSDIYAVGMIGIEALTGIQANKLVKDNSTGEIVWKNQVNVSDKLVLILDKMVSDYWKYRYQSIDEVIVELSDINNNFNNQSPQEISQQHTVVINSNQHNSQPKTTIPSTSSSSNSAQTLVKIGLGIGIAFSIIIASIIINNIPSEQETSSSTKNSQKERASVKTSTPNLISYATNISEVRTLSGHNDWIRSIAISPDGQTVVSGSWDNTIKVWDWVNGNLQGTFATQSDKIFAVAITPDGQTIISGGADGTINIWDLATGSLKNTLTGHSKAVYSIAISRDGQTVISGSADGTIKIWDLATESLKATLTGHSKAVYSVAISSEKQIIVSGSADGTIKIWDLVTGSLINTFSGHSDRIFSVAISSDGQNVVSGSADETIQVWDLRFFSKVENDIILISNLKNTLTGHSNEVWSVAISPDGQTIVSGSEDKTIKIWDLATGSLKNTLTGHTWVVTSIAISSDGQTIVSGSDDKTIKVWSAR